MLEDLKTAAADTGTKSRHGYYLLSKFEILQCGDVEKLKKRVNPRENPVYYVSIEETYDVVRRAYIATGHGGRDRMTKEINKKYVNITRDVLNLFKSYCHECQKKRKRPRIKGVVVRPILTNEFASRAQIDLIDMQSMAQKSFKWIFVYQDHLTKFVILRALTSKRAAEVAHHLLDIFLLIGAPSILQSDNGSEFTAEVISELKIVWPRLVMVHGKPRHPQSQGSPYAAMFGCEAKVGLTSSSLPTEVVVRMQSEDDLISAISNVLIVLEHTAADIHESVPSTSQEPAPSSSHEVMPNTSQEPDEWDSRLDPEMPLLSATTDLVLDSAPEYGGPPLMSPAPVTVSADLLNARIDSILNEKNGASFSQMTQAERMVKRSKLELTSGQVGDNVAVPKYSRNNHRP
ncbi:KRAB-A domain-containing protein 2-like [Gigantopelta aegis]|uniref:KRAB-A domain-containing protein 2-like n=1 Tax=Gigantopelta aegis TaxID=1735272 RepID=UPI001B88CC7F|nr:KRAB-A domain-containing protein 2-like [Gigantopelta aegis]